MPAEPDLTLVSGRQYTMFGIHIGDVTAVDEVCKVERILLRLPDLFFKCLHKHIEAGSVY